MSISKRLRFEVFKRDNFTCQYCGAKPPDTVLEVDHCHPRCEGGDDSMSNLKTACWACNRGKAHVPLTPEPPVQSFSLAGGPWDGQTFTFNPRKRSPLLWLATDDTGVLVGYPDEWIIPDDDDLDAPIEREKVRHGHPGFDYPGRPSTGPQGWFHGSYREKLNPRVIGAYWSRELCTNPAEPVEELGWKTPDDLLVELTA